eukprot:g615.t1
MKRILILLAVLAVLGCEAVNIRAGPRKKVDEEGFAVLKLVKKWWTQAGENVAVVRGHMDDLSTSFGDVSAKVKEHFRTKHNHEKLIPIVEKTEEKITSAFEGVTKELGNLENHAMKFLTHTHRVLNKTRLQEEIKENCFYKSDALKYVLAVSNECSDEKCKVCTNAVEHLDVEETRGILEKVANKEEEEKKSSSQEEKKEDEVVKKDDTQLRPEKKDPADLTEAEVQSLTDIEKGEIEAETVKTKFNGLVDAMFYVKRNRFVPGKDLNDGFRSIRISKAEMFHLQLKGLQKDFEGGKVTCGRMVSRYKDVLDFFMSEESGLPSFVKRTPYADEVKSLLKGISEKEKRMDDMKKCNGFKHKSFRPHKAPSPIKRGRFFDT